MRGYFESRESLRGLMITVDIRRGIGELDVQMLDWCSALGIPVCILATKADKLSRNKTNQAIAAMRRDAATWEASVIAFSALNGNGLEPAREQLEHWLSHAE